ncbi:MAG: glutamine--scyllo-inositol transaminase [Candidatus Saganbacteria bacterium]|uniref:Glutamine--scyllo-inositol transaminase n=1 Tax=Candidatus Saganbacteria bacterium TaxID=2575572 RepID=A0A833NXP2_UNCSA|nr:MAG: glutamine--scyllo-inositol transaminase [Candidatus Saganbacteria bacterium]
MKVVAAKPFFTEEDMENIARDIKKCLKDGTLTFGPKVREFEESFAKYIGVKHAIAVNSGTCSLEIPLKFFDVKDKEVIVPTNSFVASANTVIFAGGRPVIADIKRETLDIDPQDALKKITPKTKGIMVVHLAGLIPPEMDEIKKICKEKDLFLIEDAAQAQGATFNSHKAGSLGDAGSFSFFPTKVMTTGEGGMVTTNNDKLDEFARSMRHHGRVGALHSRLGYNWRMSDINAVIGIYQLKRLEEFVKERNRLAQRYSEGLKRIKGIRPISVPSNIRHCYYKYPVLLEGKMNARTLENILQEKYDISTATLYQTPIHLQPIYRDIFEYKEGDLPIAEEVLSKHELCLPMFVGLTDEQVDYVLEALEKEYQ